MFTFTDYRLHLVITYMIVDAQSQKIHFSLSFLPTFGSQVLIVFFVPLYGRGTPNCWDSWSELPTIGTHDPSFGGSEIQLLGLWSILFADNFQANFAYISVGFCSIKVPTIGSMSPICWHKELFFYQWIKPAPTLIEIF